MEHYAMLLTKPWKTYLHYLLIEKRKCFFYILEMISVSVSMQVTILRLQIYFSIIVWIGENLSAMSKLFLNHTQLPIAVNNWLKVSPSNLERYMLTQANNCITYLKDVESFVSNNQQVATLQEVQLNSVNTWHVNKSFCKKMYLLFCKYEPD